MQINEALNVLNDGHTIWKVGHAKRVCEALGVPFSDNLVERFYTEEHYKGAKMLEGEEGSLGVYALSLSEYVAEQLSVSKQARQFYGRGSQAREYARVVREKLGIPE